MQKVVSGGANMTSLSSEKKPWLFAVMMLPKYIGIIIRHCQDHCEPMGIMSQWF